MDIRYKNIECTVVVNYVTVIKGNQIKCKVNKTKRKQIDLSVSAQPIMKRDSMFLIIRFTTMNAANASAHSFLSVKTFFAKYGITVLDQPPSSLAWFF